MKKQTFIDLVLFKTSANLKTEVSKYYLNYLWWVIEPVLTMAIFYIVFGIFLSKGTNDFVAFLLVGICFWQWFQRSIMNASMSILGGRGLMLQVHIPKFFFPIEVVLRDCFKQFFVVFLLLVFLYFYPTGASIMWLWLPLIMIVQVLLILSLAMISAAIIPFFPDLKFIVSTLLQLLFFGSGIFFDINEVVLPKHQLIMYLNPVAGLIKNYRNILIYNETIDYIYLFNVSILSFSLFVLSLLFIIKFDSIYPRICQE